MVLAELNVEHGTDGLEALFAHERVAIAVADVGPRDPFTTLFGEQNHLGAIGVERKAGPGIGHMDAHIGSLGGGDDQARRAGVVECLVLQDG